MAIEGIICQNRGIDHKDERRTLLTAFNGDVADFVAKQAKIYQVHQDAPLGGKGHFHDYDELFYILKGEAEFSLLDTKTEERETHTLREQEILLIPARVAHKVSVKEGTLFMGFTEEVYVSPRINDHKYEFE